MHSNFYRTLSYALPRATRRLSGLGCALAVLPGCGTDAISGTEASAEGTETAPSVGSTDAGTASSGSSGDAGTRADAFESTPRGPTPNGLELPEGFEDWRLLGVASRTAPADAPTLGIILGNDAAIDAARALMPWPDGTMLVELTWSAGANPDWNRNGAVFSDQFTTLTLMVKDSQAYATDNGWAYGIWTGTDLMPPADPGFDRACVQCHVDLASASDSVFTRPVSLPGDEAIANAAGGTNGIALPADFKDWRFLGVNDRTLGTRSVRAVLGNDLAVEAARAGEDYPEGAMIADLVWISGSIPEWADAVVPAAFNAVLLMAKDDAVYADDGGWGYAMWSEPTLGVVDDAISDCIDCHTDNASDHDYVFTRSPLLPQ